MRQLQFNLEITVGGFMIKIDSNIGFVIFDGENIGTFNSSELAIVVYLIKREGQVVSKDELLAAGWPNRVVVSNSVNMAIKSIRTTFARATQEQVILTIPREGYRLMPGFIVLTSDVETETETETETDSIETTRAKVKKDIVKKNYILNRGNRISYYWIVFLIISAILWVSFFKIFLLERNLACVTLKDKVVCATEGVDLSKDILKNAPSGGTYIYGIDPISGDGVYERKN
ncbi:winged helix-turn-helix domain-containing protein [Aeromonas jandaei]|uniref:winged helix-turn-helix domain-containing protein n=1 Tax=Aeromonas jandaei TaxID=650 RepID=UPI001ABF89A3|nr:winged helix-turn-helix domain-containing protein [Aeromonas jandaei]QSR71980.1 winged helix-turn-helix transcriptional regulator [Aeromonas jandaei]